MRRQQDETYLQDENFHWNRTEAGSWLVANSPNSDFEIDFYLRKTLRTQNWLSFQPVWAKSSN